MVQPSTSLTACGRKNFAKKFPSGPSRTALAALPADAAICAACLEETFSPLERRFRYPFTTCTHCGPRFSIVRALPYDRANTTMERFELCPACQSEYDDPEDRRYHAQPLACHLCGPQVELLRTDGRAFTHEAYSMLDTVDAVGSLLQRGEIVAIEGLGGFHIQLDPRVKDNELISVSLSVGEVAQESAIGVRTFAKA